MKVSQKMRVYQSYQWWNCRGGIQPRWLGQWPSRL